MKKLIVFLALLGMVSAVNADWGGFNRQNRQKLEAANLNLPPHTGATFYANMKTGNENNSGTLPDEAVCSLQTAYGKCTAGRGDMVVLLPDSQAYDFTVSKCCTISKPLVTIVGLGGNPGYPMTRVATSASTNRTKATSIKDVFLVNAYGVRFYNLRVSNGDTGGIGAVRLTARGTGFLAENCELIGGNIAVAAADSANTHDLRCDSSSYFTLRNSILGTVEIDRNPTAVQGNVIFTGAQKGGLFENCIFKSYSDDAQRGAIRMGISAADTGVFAGYHTLRNCTFEAWAAKLPALGSVVGGNVQPRPGLLFKDCSLIGFAAIDTLDDSLSYKNGKVSEDSLQLFDAQ